MDSGSGMGLIMKKWLGTIRVLPAEASRADARDDGPAVVNDAELATHYALACKSDKVRAFLMALDAGYDFARVAAAFGDEGVRIAFECLLRGWIDRGQITGEGRAHVQNRADA
jgi:hypothetical protein